MSIEYLTPATCHLPPLPRVRPVGEDDRVREGLFARLLHRFRVQSLSGAFGLESFVPGFGKHLPRVRRIVVGMPVEHVDPAVLDRLHLGVQADERMDIVP